MENIWEACGTFSFTSNAASLGTFSFFPTIIMEFSAMKTRCLFPSKKKLTTNQSLVRGASSLSWKIQDTQLKDKNAGKVVYWPRIYFQGQSQHLLKLSHCQIAIKKGWGGDRLYFSLPQCQSLTLAQVNRVKIVFFSDSDSAVSWLGGNQIP